MRKNEWGKMIRNKVKLSLALLLCFPLVACAGLADYTIPLDNGFRIDRTSAHNIAIYGEKPKYSEDDTKYDYLYIPTEVTEVWWNDDYIAAKQIELVADERGYEQPPEKPTNSDYSYWIIDVKSRKVLGPLNEKEFGEEIDQLGITDLISLESIQKLDRY